MSELFGDRGLTEYHPFGMRKELRNISEILSMPMTTFLGRLRWNRQQLTRRMNKTGYRTFQSRTVGQEQLCKNSSQFKYVTDRLKDGGTDRHGD